QVTLAVGPIFASRWLIPRLARFRRSHPDIELILHHGARITSVENMTTPVAIDWGHGEWTGLQAQHLFNIRYVPVVSPALAEQRGGLRQPADLRRFPIIHQHDRTEWKAWAKLAGLTRFDSAEEIVIDDSNVVTGAAIDGQGVALGIFPFIDEEVASGRLLRPFDIELEPSRSYHLLSRPGAVKTPEIAALCNWLIEEGAGYSALQKSLISTAPAA
ncbi:MAG: LysR substrate-binding domain-containing protein, partial [Rhizobiaceae bacterium]